MRVVEPLLGTKAEILIVADSAKIVDQVERTVISEIERLEKVFTVFDKTSDLHAYRRTGTTSVPELRSVIDLARSWQRRTNGAFHPAIWPLVEFWNRAEAADTAPSTHDLQQVANVVQAADSANFLDLNAIAKGWIAQAAIDVAYISEQDVSSAWINLGGDIVHRGAKPLKVGIENPKRPYDNVPALATVTLSNEALATSGGSRRWWTIAKERYPKILDPRTGLTVNQVAGATVIAAHGATADVLATVALIQPQPETLAMVADANAECILVNHDGSVVSSSERFIPS